MTTAAAFCTLIGALVLAFVLERHTRAIASLPAVWHALAAQERQRAHAELKEEVAQRAAETLRALRGHEQAYEALLKRERDAATHRAQAAEARLLDTTAALQAATELVRELRALLDAQGPPRGAGKAPPSPSPSGRPTVDEQQRATDVGAPAPPPEHRAPADSQVLHRDRPDLPCVHPEVGGDSADGEVTTVAAGALRLPATILPPAPGAAPATAGGSR